MDLADTYIMFVRQNQDILREKVNEEMYIEKLFDVSKSSFKVLTNILQKEKLTLIIIAIQTFPIFLFVLLIQLISLYFFNSMGKS